MATNIGAEVFALVDFCTDAIPDQNGRKPPWRERKEHYIAHLMAAEGPGLLVSACDKLANLQAILLDLTEVGPEVWTRFTGGKDGSLWYYQALVDAFAGRIPERLERALWRELSAVLEMADGCAWTVSPQEKTS